MAVLALIGGVSVVLQRGLTAQATRPAQGQGPARDEEKAVDQPAQAASAKPSDSFFPMVHLSLRIAGLGSEGCSVEVKPANAACKFRTAYLEKGSDGALRVIPPPQHVQPNGWADLDLRDVELRGADHTCTLAIVVHEPGQPASTFYRGFRLTTPAKTKGTASASTIPTITCYLRSRVAASTDSRVRK
jgi:hypothetical protein